MDAEIIKHYRSLYGPYVVTVYFDNHETDEYTYENVIEVAFDDQLLVIKYEIGNEVWTEHYNLNKIESWRIHTKD